MIEFLRKMAVIQIFTRINNGEGEHGSFLRSFAQTLILADEDNYVLMEPAALVLIHKYHLNTLHLQQTHD